MPSASLLAHIVSLIGFVLATAWGLLAHRRWKILQVLVSQQSELADVWPSHRAMFLVADALNIRWLGKKPRFEGKLCSWRQWACCLDLHRESQIVAIEYRANVSSGHSGSTSFKIWVRRLPVRQEVQSQLVDFLGSSVSFVKYENTPESTN